MSLNIVKWCLRGWLRRRVATGLAQTVAPPTRARDS